LGSIRLSTLAIYMLNLCEEKFQGTLAEGENEISPRDWFPNVSPVGRFEPHWMLTETYEMLNNNSLHSIFANGRLTFFHA